MLEDNKEPEDQASFEPTIEKATLVITMGRIQEGIETDVFVNKEGVQLTADDVLESLGDIAFDIVHGVFSGALTEEAK